MDANPFDAPGHLPNFLDDGQAVWNTGFPVMPRGPCNYTDPSLPRCGCRRFWSKLNTALDAAELCQCSHHACFHDDFPAPSQLQPTASFAFAGVPATNGYEKPASSFNTQRVLELASPMEEIHRSFAQPNMSQHLGVSTDFGLMNVHAASFNQRIIASQPLQIQEQPHQSMEKQATISDNAPVTGWDNGKNTQATEVYEDTQPLSPAYIHMQSQGTTASSQMRYLTPFFGKGLNTMTRPSSLRNEATISDNGVQDVEDQAQPAAQAECGPMDLMAPPMYKRDVTPRPGSAHSQSLLTVKKDVNQLSEVVHLQEARIDKLENTSFSVIGHDECYDKHEHIDLRVTDLESRVDEVEKILNDNSSVAGASVVSVASNNTVRSSQKVTLSQFKTLQAQISELQATSLPTYNKPWNVEVVFLPFPLKGVWVDSRKIFDRRQSMGPDEDWTQLPSTLSRATPDPTDPGFTEWPGQDPDSGWLLPKAFANGRMIDQRLRSRGFIKTVQVRGPDARDVQLAIHKAFGNVLEPSTHLIYHSKAAPESPLNEFLGLRQDWVPLRKIHKDNRLRFLAPAEMATPALWGYTFLMSSVVMKAPKTIGTHRLYITQPEAYIQDYITGNRALMPAWTWQRIRELSRVYPDKQHNPDETDSERDHTPEGDALEECWTRSDVLDDLPKTGTADLRYGHVQASYERSDTASFETALTSIKTTRTRAESPRAVMLKKGKGSFTPLSRSRSYSPASKSSISPTASRYHQTPSSRLSRKSYERSYDRRSSPLVSGKARQTTPRYDRYMSREPSLPPLGWNDRRPTPGYYNTPHSEHPSSEHGNLRGSSREPWEVEAPDSDQEMTGLSSGSDDSDNADDEDDEMTDCPIDDRATIRRFKSVQIPRAIPETSSSFSSSQSDFFDLDGDDLDQDDELDGAKTDGEGRDHEHGQPGPVKSQDIPRAGIETDDDDLGPFSQQSNLFPENEEDLDMDDGSRSDSSEAPSEYPSKNISSALPPETTKLPPPLISSGSGSRDGSQPQQQQPGYHHLQQQQQQQYPFPREPTKDQKLVLDIQELVRLGQQMPGPEPTQVQSQPMSLPQQRHSQGMSQVSTEADSQGSQDLGQMNVMKVWTASTTTTLAEEATAHMTTVIPPTTASTNDMVKGKEKETDHVQGVETDTQKRIAPASNPELGPSWTTWAETATGKWGGFGFKIYEDEVRNEKGE
ncbi:hypothetical protein B0T20DRAFT_104740 [Sordaria brevicollis]|uniref:Uncharacterized protein n=1 Tax=Sordaria brevicollis TaxID=83679 RepID=A0AAE0U2E9_SORBR|nr:hypothetical protein B0T20DRAFT_104740 [Sordaria brevicollis]